VTVSPQVIIIFVIKGCLLDSTTKQWHCGLKGEAKPYKSNGNVGGIKGGLISAPFHPKGLALLGRCCCVGDGKGGGKLQCAPRLPLGDKDFNISPMASDHSTFPETAYLLPFLLPTTRATAPFSFPPLMVLSSRGFVVEKGKVLS